MQRSNEIVKITYREKIINPDDLSRPTRVAISIYANGNVSISEYSYEKKQYILSERYSTEIENFLRLGERIDTLIKNATGIYTLDDDTDGEVTIYRAFGRVEKIDRCYGTEEKCICELITNYFYYYRREAIKASRGEEVK